MKILIFVVSCITSISSFAWQYKCNGDGIKIKFLITRFNNMGILIINNGAIITKRAGSEVTILSGKPGELFVSTVLEKPDTKILHINIKHPESIARFEAFSFDTVVTLKNNLNAEKYEQINVTCNGVRRWKN